MSDKFQPVTMETLCAWIFGEWDSRRSIFGIPEELFFKPSPSDPFRQKVYDQPLDTPFGVAAGPHSQMAQNIVVAWLCGARFIELKTIQTLDELNVSKPCIDMQDAGYNVEWSQELKVHESYAEYLRAWVLIHALHRMLDFPGDKPGVIFNMSVGYDMKGILKPNVQAFLKLMENSEERIHDYLAIIRRHVPHLPKVSIPARISNNVTLSTMHGCPPEEIGTISRYLMKECGLHTSVKMNPTLLGPDRLRDILNHRLGYRDIEVPDSAFGHDLKYPDALALIRDLRKQADESGVRFGVKLSNTLEVVNHRPVFASHEKMMYLSGRPLHALTVNLAARLDDDFNGELAMSFAGGADAFNVEALLAAGMQTVTVCSDLLRSGGYTRLGQYIENTRGAMQRSGAGDLRQFRCAVARSHSAFAASLCSDQDNKNACARLNLKKYAESVLDEAAWKKDTFDRHRTKTTRKLEPFDCIKAPCTDECPINQKVPEYMNLVRNGMWQEAARVTREDNPLPFILGRACNHLCECTCVRTHYDHPLAIREIKRAIMDHETRAEFPLAMGKREEKIAVIGAGPCGLSVAYFLSLAGYTVEIFEARPYAGGMVSGTIPGYRAAMNRVRFDMDTVISLGAKVHYDQKAGRDFTLPQLRERGFAAIVVAIGVQHGGRLGVEGEDAGGVYDALDFLRASREGHPPSLGSKVAVIGGGDVAMDCARTARRLGAKDVQLVYRRTLEQMPASRDELRELLDEQIPVMELTAPKRMIVSDGNIHAIECLKMKLGDPDASGRRRPVEISGSEFNLEVDQVVVAVNQRPDYEMFAGEMPQLNNAGFIQVDEGMRTSIPDVYAGGDVGPAGPASIVKALGDGRKIAKSIRVQLEGAQLVSNRINHGLTELSREEEVDLLRRRSIRLPRLSTPQLPLEQRRDFDEVILTMPEADAREEAARCLDCHKLCSYCVGVCPNLALFTYKNNVSGTWMLPVLSNRRGKWLVEKEVPVCIGQRYQVAVLTDFCNECGNCVTFCPAAGKPYLDKPRLYLTGREFEAQRDNAYLITRDDGKWAIHARVGGKTISLIWQDDHLGVTTPGFSATLDPSTLQIRHVQESSIHDDGNLSLEPVAGMWVLLNVLKDEMPYFPSGRL